MTLRTTLSNSLVTAQAQVFASMCSNGTIKIYDGEQPESPDMPATGTLGATLTFATTAFTNTVLGFLETTTLTSGVAVASITPTWARIASSTGVPIADISAGPIDCNITIQPFTTGQTVSCPIFTHAILRSVGGI